MLWRITAHASGDLPNRLLPHRRITMASVDRAEGGDNQIRPIPLAPQRTGYAGKSVVPPAFCNCIAGAEAISVSLRQSRVLIDRPDSLRGKRGDGSRPIVTLVPSAIRMVALRQQNVPRGDDIEIGS